jgi:hypothetical protein
VRERDRAGRRRQCGDESREREREKEISVIDENGRD